MDIRYQWKIIEINGTIIHAKELDRYRAGTFAWCFHVVFPQYFILPAVMALYQL
jgi:hypothetical protein